MGEVDGIEVMAEEKAAWDAAVASFEQTRRALRLALLRSSVNVGGIEAEPVTVIGASEYGLDGSRAILT